MSFIEVAADSDFPIQNLPYGVFRRNNGHQNARVGVAIGDYVLDLAIITDAGLFSSVEQVQNTKCFHQETLNTFMSFGRSVWKATRSVITQLLSKDTPTLRDNADIRSKALVPMNDVTMVLPANIGDYTDFYASKEHATNIGTMWRGKENALMPNWLHIPIGYHGRSSSIVVDGTPVRRPRGQTKPVETEPPIFGPSKVCDYEVEMGFFVGPASKQGDPIDIKNAEDHIFGLVILNDWSARDVQKWEYQPLGPFCAKNWATTISPWVVTLEALEPFRTPGPAQEPTPLPYLQDNTPGSYDINLVATLQTEKAKQGQVFTKTNFKYMYWSMKQQLAHHTSTGCNVRPGDLLASGTISGSTPDSFGSLSEITWGGSKVQTIAETGEERKYIQDGDTINMTGFCQGQGYRIGFGNCSGKLLPAHTN
eukprot:TRINITY_DN2116_c0_g1_i2.p1 TRINITY_DN2116_c0_g1~~TRINITY_DN2116_c0_g1_i2.p1  ORF type:complete len:423 (+),score=83.32 TRINITY_DN2116_c0_g1_i2:50-1318(+)